MLVNRREYGWVVCLWGVCVKEGCECPGVCVYRGVRGMYNSGPRGRHPFPVNRITDVSKNITLPQTSFVGGQGI